MLHKDDPRRELPQADEYIVSYWHDLGMCLNGGYGNTPLTYSEIKAYSDTVSDLSPFDCKMLVVMSKAYISECHAATEEYGRPSPIEFELEAYHKIREFNQAQISKKMRALASQAK